MSAMDAFTATSNHTYSSISHPATTWSTSQSSRTVRRLSLCLIQLAHARQISTFHPSTDIFACPIPEQVGATAPFILRCGAATDVPRRSAAVPPQLIQGTRCRFGGSEDPVFTPKNVVHRGQQSGRYVRSGPHWQFWTASLIQHSRYDPHALRTRPFVPRHPCSPPPDQLCTSSCTYRSEFPRMPNAHAAQHAGTSPPPFQPLEDLISTSLSSSAWSVLSPFTKAGPNENPAQGHNEDMARLLGIKSVRRAFKLGCEKKGTCVTPPSN
jgi:hypothetical protein